jgi:pSer/pThr/pTyr-binding forkhead associated (FHA) protein
MIVAELHVVGGKHVGQIIPLNRKKFLIGREQDCHLRPNSELVSRHHCIFTVDDYSVRLRDLGSTNGTQVNGQRIVKEVVLNPGDQVIVGNLEFELKTKDAQSSEVTAAPQTGEASKDDTVIAASATLTDLKTEQPTPPQEVPAAPQEAPAAENAQVTQSGEQQIATPAPNVGTGDTTVISQPIMMPGQMPYQPMMPQMGGGYPPQMYPGYPYPPQMHMYPQGYPQQMMPGYPQQQQPQQQQPAASTATQSSGPEVMLPDPSETGATDAPPSGSSGSKKGDDQSTGAADAIIKQYMQRRPGGSSS